MQAEALKPGDKVTIANIPMQFSHWDNNNPAFIHTVGRDVITYVNRAFTQKTPVKDLK
jgi:hypothetical protein